MISNKYTKAYRLYSNEASGKLFLQRRTGKTVKKKFLNVINTAINRVVNDQNIKLSNRFNVLPSAIVKMGKTIL